MYITRKSRRRRKKKEKEKVVVVGAGGGMRLDGVGRYMHRSGYWLGKKEYVRREEREVREGGVGCFDRRVPGGGGGSTRAAGRQTPEDPEASFCADTHKRVRWCAIGLDVITPLLLLLVPFFQPNSSNGSILSFYQVFLWRAACTARYVCLSSESSLPDDGNNLVHFLHTHAHQ